MYVNIHNMAEADPRASGASPRERMVVSAALLIRERGAHPTAIADVLEHSGAPRGSAYHYFPGGRTQLLCEAVDYAGDYVAAKIARGPAGLDVLDALMQSYREQLIRSDYRAGCPIVAVAVEAGVPDNPNPVAERAAKVFSRWTELITTRLVTDGITAVRAAELAMLITASIEGAIVVARASRDVSPLDTVHRELRALLRKELGDDG